MALEPIYVDQVFKHLDSVPIIAVVKIETDAVSPAGLPTSFPSIFPAPLVLFRVKTVVENVLKGDLVPGRAEFHYFAPASVTGSPKLGFYATEPDRSLILLRRTEGSCEPLPI